MERPVATLGDVATWGSGGTPKRSVREYFGRGTPWLSIADMNDDVVYDAKEGLTPLGIANSSAKVVPAGTILIAMYGSIGKLGIAGCDLCTSQAIAFAIPDERRIDRRYLFNYLLAQRPGFVARGRGGTQMNIGQADLKEWPIPLPPIGEQRWIADILDRAYALRAKRREALTLLDDLTQSIFLDMFGDPVINDRGWDDSCRLGDLADITSGITKGRRLSDGILTREVPYMAVVNVQDRRLDLSTVKTILATEDEIQRYRLQSGDLLLTEGGDPDKLGRGTLWASELVESIHQNHIFRVRIQDARLRPLYLNWLLGSERGRRYFLKSAKQTTGIAPINMTQLRAFPTLLPPLDAQLEFESALGGVRRAASTASQAAHALDSLFASLQQRAFAGEL